MSTFRRRRRSSATRRIRAPASRRSRSTARTSSTSPRSGLAGGTPTCIFKASIDDDVKVLVVRGVGDHLGTGADLDELMSKRAAGIALHEEFGLTEDDDVTMPNARSYRAGASLLHWYGNTRSGCRSLQDFKKISILEVKGYCYGWHFYQAGGRRPRHLVRRCALRPSRLPLRRLRAAHVAVGDDDGAAQVPGDGVHRPPVHRRGDVRLQLREQRRAARRPRGGGRRSTRCACARTRPTDTVFMQKVFFEIMKQHQGEYMGSLLSAWLESMGGMLREDEDGKLANPQPARRWTPG